MIRVGILGCSDIARRKFLPALLDSGLAFLVAAASRQRNKAASLVYGLPVKLMTYHEMVSSPDIDLIYLSLPNHLHEEWSICALEQGKHVICEKPLGLSADSVKRMLETADRNDRLLYENLMYLQHPQHKAVKSFIATGRIGKKLSLHSEFTFPGPVEGDFRLDPAMGGGAFHDMNRYPLSAALYFLRGETYSYQQGSIDIQGDLTSSLQAESITDAGEEFSFRTSFNLPYRSFYKVTGELGSIRVERAYTTPSDSENRIFVTINNRDESFQVPPCDHFLATIEHVCGLILSGAWCEEHDRARKLAELAGMFQDSCMRKGQKNEAD